MCLFSSLHSIPLCGYTAIYPFHFDKHLRSLQVLFIANNSAMNILAHIHWWTYVCISIVFIVDIFFVVIRDAVEVNIFANVSCTFHNTSIKYIFRIAGSCSTHDLSRCGRTGLRKHFDFWAWSVPQVAHRVYIPLPLSLSVTQMLLLCLLDYKAKLMKTRIFFLARFRHSLVG